MINVLDGTGGYDGKVSPRYLQRVVNRIVKYFTDTPVDSRPYKVYTAKFVCSTQVVTVFENTLGVDVAITKDVVNSNFGCFWKLFSNNSV